MTLETFKASGSFSKDNELLKETLMMAFKLLNTKEIKYYSYEKLKDKEDLSVLVFWDRQRKCNNKFPFVIKTNDETYIQMLITHIYDYISNLSKKELKQFGCESSGYEESYEIGWEIYKPSWVENDGLCKIENVDWGMVLAVKPIFIEYGK